MEIIESFYLWKETEDLTKDLPAYLLYSFHNNFSLAEFLQPV
jgi:hypothetical protein